MLNNQQMEEYRKLRAKGVSPRDARSNVKGWSKSEKFDWDSVGRQNCMWRAQTTEPTNEGPCKVTIIIGHDEHPDLSWIGTHHDMEVPGAENWHHFIGLEDRQRRSGPLTHIMRWFRPQFSYDELLQDTHGMSRQDAHLYARKGVDDQMRQMREIHEGESLCVNIRAIAYLNGIELGDELIGGFVFNPSRDRDWDYINDSAREIVDQAVANATTNLCPTCHGSGRSPADGK